MRPRASRKGRDYIFALPKWLIFLACLILLTVNGVIAQKENETFESAFGLNLLPPETIEELNMKKAEMPRAKAAEEPLELEELASEEKDLTPIEEKNDGENPPIQVAPKTEEAFASEDVSGEVSPAVQTISAKVATNEKNGKYVRYGKSKTCVINWA